MPIDRFMAGNKQWAALESHWVDFVDADCAIGRSMPEI
jgi:hypothetical protein